MKQRYVRPGDELDNATVVVVRGGDLDARLIRSDAERMHTIYGVYGISVFAVRSMPFDELAQRSPLVRFARLTVVTVGALRSAGLGLEATGRNPEHFTGGAAGPRFRGDRLARLRSSHRRQPVS